jgi:hypothetical protein
MGMIKKIDRFWKEHKDTIKNVIIAVAVPVAIASLMGLRSMEKVIVENDLTDLFYGEVDIEAE